ncbi:MAG: pilin [Patescibacteria group bacterium]
MTDFKSLIQTIIENIFNPLVALILTLALVYFLWGIVKYLQAVGDETKRKEGISMMTYGVIALFVMVSVWGLVKVIKNTFPLDYDTPTRPPIPASPITS